MPVACSIYSFLAVIVRREAGRQITAMPNTRTVPKTALIPFIFPNQRLIILNNTIAAPLPPQYKPVTTMK